MLKKFFFLGFVLSFVQSQTAFSKIIQKSEIITFKKNSTTYHINALFLTEDNFSKTPLVILSHGTPFNMIYAPQVLIEGMVDQASEFLKLGFAVLIVERRGFGHSKEKLVEFTGDCDHHDQIASGKEASSDILGALDFAQSNLNIDPEKIILAGHSAGGFVSVFASGYQHKGVRAVINIEGGRGFDGNKVCSKESLLEAYKFSGKTSRVPMLWIYTKNDHVFSPELAELMLSSFKSEGGKPEFIMLPPFQEEGHALFDSPEGFRIWQPLVKDFLKKMQICPQCS